MNEHFKNFYDGGITVETLDSFLPKVTCRAIEFAQQITLSDSDVEEITLYIQTLESMVATSDDMRVQKDETLSTLRMLLARQAGEVVQSYKSPATPQGWVQDTPESKRTNT